MNKQITNKKDGFTIIEVVLVLAIAGLIFLIVFLAVPALQRNQRDTQRRSDMSRFMAQVQNFQSNNKGKVPTEGSGAGSVEDFVTRYMTTGVGDEWADPEKGTVYTKDGGTPTATGTYYYKTSMTCDGETMVAAGGRKVAVMTKLEGGALYCASN